MNLINKPTNNSNKQVWNQFIKQHAPYRYHFTLTFSRSLSDEESYKAMMFYLHLINQKIFGSRYKKNNNHLEGFIFAERQLNGTVHYHSLIKNNDLFNEEGKPSLHDHVFNLASKVKKADCFSGYTDKGVISHFGVRLDDVYNDGIIDYLTKTMPSRGEDTSRFRLCKNSNLS